MALFSIIVEGSHDASFIGHLLKARTFSAVNTLSKVPDEWRALFPRQFPLDGENLDRVMRFPEVFLCGDVSVGISTAGSDSKLISTLRVVLDVIGSDQLSGVGIFADTDNHDPASRFEAIQKNISVMNVAASKEGQPGYPIVIPSSAGDVQSGQPAVGIYLFPNNADQGCLEDLLLECAHTNHPQIATASVNLVADIDAATPAGQADLKTLRSGMGRRKASVGVIANILRPGVSVASSLAQTSWLSASALKVKSVKAADDFLDKLFSA